MWCLSPLLADNINPRATPQGWMLLQLSREHLNLLLDRMSLVQQWATAEPRLELAEFEALDLDRLVFHQNTLLEGLYEHYDRKNGDVLPLPPGLDPMGLRVNGQPLTGLAMAESAVEELRLVVSAGFIAWRMLLAHSNEILTTPTIIGGTLRDWTVPVVPPSPIPIVAVPLHPEGVTTRFGPVRETGRFSSARPNVSNISRQHSADFAHWLDDLVHQAPAVDPGQPARDAIDDMRAEVREMMNLPQNPEDGWDPDDPDGDGSDGLGP